MVGRGFGGGEDGGLRGLPVAECDADAAEVGAHVEGVGLAGALVVAVKALPTCLGGKKGMKIT